MKTIVLLALVIVAGVFFFKQQSGSHDDLSALQSRLDAAERSYQAAGRAAGVSGMDMSADAASALAEVEQVERELKELSRKASGETKVRIDKLLAHASTVKSKLR